MANETTRRANCEFCGSRTRVVRYIEDNCAYYYELGCRKCGSQMVTIPVGRPLKPGSMCPNCLVGIMLQVPIGEKGIRLSCDSCLVEIPFAYALKAALGQ